MNKHPSLEKAKEDQTNPCQDPFSLFVSSPSRSEATKTIETLPADFFSHELDPFASLLNHNGKSKQNAGLLTPALLLQNDSMFKEEILCQEKLYDRAQKKQGKDDELELKTHVEAEDEQQQEDFLNSEFNRPFVSSHSPFKISPRDSSRKIHSGSFSLRRREDNVPSPSAPVPKKLNMPFLADWNNANDDYNERRNGFFLQQFKQRRY